MSELDEERILKLICGEESEPVEFKRALWVKKGH